jgi:hypothetical protein
LLGASVVLIQQTMIDKQGNHSQISSPFCSGSIGPCVSAFFELNSTAKYIAESRVLRSIKVCLP